MTLSTSNFYTNFESRRDTYGFAVRPQHLQRYREYANIYKEEEEERSEKWKAFLAQHVEPAHQCSEEESVSVLYSEVTEQKTEPASGAELIGEGDDSCEASGEKSASKCQTESCSEKVVPLSMQSRSLEVQTWARIRPALNTIDNMMSFRVKRRKSLKLDSINASLDGSFASDGVFPEPSFPSKEELEFLVRGGVPRDLRGEVWQAFVGVRTRRIENYYQDLLTSETGSDTVNSHNPDGSKGPNKGIEVPEKWRKQIEKDLPRTFPGHPALDEVGRNSLRRLLLAYARHNPSVGYCQAMNFFAGLLLLMMPEENAFWTLVGIIDDYFDGYFSQEMIESQVDQLVFEELTRERFPKLVNHLDYLGLQVAWVSGPWFLSIFVNMLPWESVLRVWDVLLFEGNRVMLFRTALALMELYGPAVVTTKDAGDAIALLQSLAGSTFDSSQLVLTACMGFLTVTENRLQKLRDKHRPAILESVEERRKGSKVWNDSKGLATKLYSFKHDPKSLIKETNTEQGSGHNPKDGDRLNANSLSTDTDEFLGDLTIDTEVDSLPDLQEQVVWLKAELSSLLEEKRSATLRAEELETALMEMVKQDNRRQLSARVEQLEQEVAELRQALHDKKEQESAMIQVLMRVEQEQKVTEDARIFAEQDAAAQRYAVQILQGKHGKAMAALAEMKKRAVMAESLLEATLKYESGQTKALSSQQPPAKKTGLLSFGLGWRDKNKGKPSNASDTNDSNSGHEGASGTEHEE